MRPLFADTSYFIAVLNTHDAAHRQAVTANRDPERAIVTTEWVLTEVGNSMSKSGRRRQFQELVRSLKRNDSVEVIPATSELFDRGCALYFSRPDKEWSLTDCISFAVMQDRNLTDVLTGDHHFEQAGFRALLR
jgi:hypothetical protein